MGDLIRKCFIYLAIFNNVSLQDTNVLGFKGPRKMTIVIPSMGIDSKRLAVRPKMVRLISILWLCTLSKLLCS